MNFILISISKPFCLKDFLTPDIGVSQKAAYNLFIDNFLNYQRLVNYTSSLNDVLELPYCLYYDTIYKLIKMRKDE